MRWVTSISESMSKVLKAFFCCVALLSCDRLASAQSTDLVDPCGDPAMESSAWAGIKGKVLKVEDGDTFTISVRGKGVKRINLIGIEAPRLDQPLGEAARNLLERLVSGRAVEVWVKPAWRERMPSATAGVVHLRNIEMLDVNLLLIQSGLARYKEAEPYSMSSHTACHYVKAEEDARNARRGLWTARD